MVSYSPLIGLLFVGLSYGGIVGNLYGLKYGYTMKANITQEISIDVSAPEPPPIDQAARMARYIVSQSDWCSVSHLSLQKDTYGYPMARVFSVSDGPVGSSSGIPYIYTSLMDEGTRDILVTGRASMTMSLAQGHYCWQQNLDTEDPRCPQVILTGIFSLIKNDTEEWNTASTALFSKHPQMKNWPTSHHFQFGKLDIQYILLVDNVGGNKYPTVADYFNSTPPQVWGSHHGKIITRTEEVIAV